MDAMQFAVPFIKVAGNPTGNLPETSQISDVLDADNREEGEEYLTEEIVDETSTVSPPAPSPSGTSTYSSALSQEDRVGTPVSRMSTGTRGLHGQPIRKRKTVQSGAADKAFLEYLCTKQAKLSAPLPIKDEREKREEGIKNFVLSLIPDLMQFNDAQLRTFKRKTLLLIDEVGENSGTVSSDSGMIQTSTNNVVASSKKLVLPSNKQVPSTQSFNDEEFRQFPGHCTQFQNSRISEFPE